MYLKSTSGTDSATYGNFQMYRGANKVGNGVGIALGLLNSTLANTEYAYIGTLIESCTNAQECGAIGFYTTTAGIQRCERLRITSAGNVGIGTSTPGTKLEISSTAADADRTCPHNVLTITALQNNAPYGPFGGSILFKNSSYVTGVVCSARIRSVIYDDGAPANCGGGIWLETTPTPGGALTPSLVVDYQGRVGIGTTSPNTKLSLIGDHVSGQSVLKVQSATAYSSGGLSSIGFNDSDGTRKSIIYT
jgi:hypothetical protein